jgi:predicted PurR-regulated permease PerM
LSAQGAGGALGARTVARTVLVVVAVVVTLYLVYLLRQPIGWVLIALFVAVALAGPVNRLARHMSRGLAIALVYLGLLAVPLALVGLLVPPVVSEADELANDLPRFADDVQRFVQDNERLRSLDEDYDITGRLQEQAQELPARLGDAAGVLGNVGLGLVNSVFALVTILVLTAFILGSGPRWRAQALQLVRDRDRAERLREVTDRIGGAVGGYVAGALLIAAIAGTLNFVVLMLLGVDFALPLAVMSAAFSLIPLIGATIAAVLIGLVTLFTDFPTATIVWVLWAIVYQQLENNVVQPQVQKRTVQVAPFITLVAVLFGSTLLGVLGALVAIPIAASLQIALREWWAWRVERGEDAPAAGTPAVAAATPGGSGAVAAGHLGGPGEETARSRSARPSGPPGPPGPPAGGAG